MRVRRTLLAAALLAAVGGSVGATSASAYCDPKYRPLCTNDCQMQLPDPKDPFGTIFRVCPE